MPKTLTLRVEDSVYQLFKKAADGERRTLSNFMEYAALNYVIREMVVSDDEMQEILSNKSLVQSLKRGMKDIARGRYRIVR